MSTHRSLSGVRVVITGGARGIGLATARELVAQGAHVVIGDLTDEAVAAGVDAIGHGAEGHVVDIANAQSFADFYAKASVGGPVDVLINNAGIMPIGPFHEQSSDVLRRAMDVNVVGCAHGVQAALRDMLPRGRGQIINVASTAGKAPVPGGVIYCASKAAVVMLTEAARVEYAGRGIEFTCVMPHFTKTELVAGTKETRFIPMAQPEDVARAVAAAIVTPAKDVYVPALMTPVMATQRFLPRRVRDWVSGFLGADTAFVTIDHTARAGYDHRISGV